MVVAQVIGNLSIGGAERLFVNLCNSMRRDTAVVVLIGDIAEQPNLVRELRGDIEVHCIHVRKRSWPRNVWKLAKLFRETGCDVVHTHMFWPNVYGALAARIAGVPLVTSEHGRNEWKNRWHKWLEINVISRFAKARLCVSQDILRRRRESDGVPAKLLKLVPNGTVVPPLVEVKRKTVLVGSVGRLVDAKDFPTLIQAVSILVGRGEGIHLEIVGEGPERTEIEDAIKREGVEKNVMLAGSQTKVDDWLARWSIFASSSIREGQPIALLEAMAVGLPSVVTAVGGVPDTLEDGVEGVVVPPDNPEALANGMQRLLNDFELRKRFGEAARERVILDFSIDSLVATCEQVYASALPSPVVSVGS
jgi:glycosyltransferase involved in cell wall biosynthesis